MQKHVEKRPWGNFEQFCANTKCTVKIITVLPNEALSLQYHNQREEFWKIISGKAQVLIGDKIIDANKDDEFFIPKLTKHRIKTNESVVKLLEISFGEFDENDIVRLEDKYKRL